MNAKTKANPRAGIIVIGDEILSGRTRDSNINWLAGKLDSIGIELCEARVIPDERDVIVATVRAFSRGYDFVFTSGGIGPTHDDITTPCVAAAFERAVERNADAEARLIAHYRDTDIELNEARLKMADIPKGATLIDNPVSAAPGFIVENVYVFAGVPEILQAMFESVASRLAGGVATTRITVQCATAEGNIAVLLQDVQGAHDGVSIGSYPWFKPGVFGTAIAVSGLDADVVWKAARAVQQGVAATGAKAHIDESGAGAGAKKN